MSVRPDGTGLHTITRTGGLITQSAWSPNGARVSYFSDGPRPFGSSPRPGLWTAGPDGNTPELVVHGRDIAYVDW